QPAQGVHRVLSFLLKHSKLRATAPVAPRHRSLSQRPAGSNHGACNRMPIRPGSALLNAVTLLDAPVAPHHDDDSAVTPQARTALWASLVGTTIEWYDFFLYATAAGLVFNHAFFPDHSTFVGTMLSFATFAVGFVVRPIGGVVFGHVGDRIGRKRTLALTMVLMGGATALMGVLPTAAQIGALAPILLLL